MGQEEPKIGSVPVFKNLETNANIRTLAMDGKFLWIGLSNGIIRLDTETEAYDIYSARSTQGAFLSNGIFKIKVDKEGNKWFATYGGGLARLRGEAWTVYTPYGMGPTSYGAGWTSFKGAEGLGDLWAYDIFFEPDTMWVATWKGASLFNGKTFKTYTQDDGLPDKWVYAIGKEKDGSFWFGTEGGVTHYIAGKWVNYTHKDGLGAEISDNFSPHSDSSPSTSHHAVPGKKIITSNPNYVLTVAIDGSNNKWFGTWGGGIAKFDGKTWTNFTKADGIGGNFVNALLFDERGRLWAGTNGGVSVYDGKKWKTFSENDGLINNNVFALAFDSRGAIYLGTWKGLSKMENPN